MVSRDVFNAWVRESEYFPSVASIGREICLCGKWVTECGRISRRLLHSVNRSRLHQQSAEQVHASVDKHVKKFQKWLDESKKEV